MNMTVSNATALLIAITVVCKFYGVAIAIGYVLDKLVVAVQYRRSE